MHAGYGKGNVGQRRRRPVQNKTRLTIGKADPLRAVIGIGTCAIGDDRPVACAQDFFDVIIIDAGDDRPIKWHAVHILGKRLFDIAYVRIAIEMVRFYIGDHRD